MQSLIERYGKSIAVSFGMGLLLALLVLPVVTHAQTPRERAQELRTQSQNRAEDFDARVQEKRAAAQTRADAKRDEVKARLADKKLELCQKREEKVQNIMARIADRGEKHLGVFNKISERVQTFYDDKGLSAANYDELVAAVDEKRVAAEAEVAVIAETSVDFDCEGDNPLGVAAAFKDSLKAQIAALKEYRTAVKDLIVGVRTGAEGADDTEAKPEEETEGTENETETENENETEEGGEQ